jgi:hypothetical protein
MTLRITLSLFLLIALHSSTIFAQTSGTFNWSLNGSGTWSNPVNWGVDNTPGVGATTQFSDFTPAVFPPPAIAPSASINLEGTKVTQNVNFLSGNSTTVFTIGAGGQTLNLDGGASSSISRQGSANSSFAASVNLLGTGKTISISNTNATGTLAFTTLNIGNSNSLTVSGAGTTNISALSGSGTSSIATFSGTGNSALSSISNVATINVQGGIRNLGTVSGANRVNLSGGSATIGTLNTATINVTGGSHTITQANQSTVNLGNAATLSSSISVNSNSVLNGTGTINGNVVIRTNATHSPGNSPGTQTIAGNLSYEAGSTFVWELNGNSVNNTDFDRIQFSGAGRSLSVGGAMNTRLNFVGANFNDAFWTENRSWTVFSNVDVTQDSVNNMNIVIDTPGAPNGTLAWVFDSNSKNLSLRFSAVPEPGTMALLGLATCLVGFAKRRKLKHLVSRT